MQLDLGGIAKGYVGDEITALFRQHDISSAMINLGGNLHVIGSKPDGSPWKVGIKSPSDDSIFGVLSVTDKCIITSGAYERYFIGEDGKKYGHIINPHTGQPVDNGLLSVTVVGNEGRMCDALSTALFVMGLEGASDYWRTHEGFELILLTDDGVLYVTEGLRDSFSVQPSALVRAMGVIEK